MIQKQFYLELGKFLYAISKADGMAQQKEIKEVERLIHRELRRHKRFQEHPEYKMLALTLISFGNCIKDQLNTEEAATSFLTFAEKYSGDLDDHMKQLAWSLIRAAAQAWHGVSDPELKLLKKAQAFLEER